MTDSAKPVPKKNRHLKCTCPRDQRGEWIRELDGKYRVAENCPIHGKNHEKDYLVFQKK